MNEETRTAIMNEVEIMKNLNSANCVRYYDMITTRTHCNLVLELCPDGDLEGLLEKRGGRIPEEEAIPIIF